MTHVVIKDPFYSSSFRIFNSDSRSVTSASSFQEAENVSEKVIETHETSAQAVLCVENADIDSPCPATDAELAVEASIPKDARQEATIHGWEERNASSMPASKRERWILWLIRAARMLASKMFVDKICPVCGAQGEFYTVDDAYNHILNHRNCWFAIRKEEKFNEEENERVAQWHSC